MCVSFRSLASTPDIDDVSARGFVSFHRTGVPARVEEHARACAHAHFDRRESEGRWRMGVSVTQQGGVLWQPWFLRGAGRPVEYKAVRNARFAASQSTFGRRREGREAGTRGKRAARGAAAQKYKFALARIGVFHGVCVSPDPADDAPEEPRSPASPDGATQPAR